MAFAQTNFQTNLIRQQYFTNCRYARFDTLLIRSFVKHFRLAKLFQRYLVSEYTRYFFMLLNADDESEAIGFNVETVEVTCLLHLFYPVR